MAAHVNNNITSNFEPEAEESGWTAYLEDFSYGPEPSFISSPSLVSDAAWNGVDTISHVRRLNFKNLKRSSNKKYSPDDDLEDTASSPVNSPKVSDNSKEMMEVNYRSLEHDHISVAGGNFLGKRGCSSNLSEAGANEKTGKKIENNVDLRQRGLCLVPMATFINFHG